MSETPRWQELPKKPDTYLTHYPDTKRVISALAIAPEEMDGLWEEIKSTAPTFSQSPKLAEVDTQKYFPNNPGIAVSAYDREFFHLSHEEGTQLYKEKYIDNKKIDISKGHTVGVEKHKAEFDALSSSGKQVTRAIAVAFPYSKNIDDFLTGQGTPELLRKKLMAEFSKREAALNPAVKSQESNGVNGTPTSQTRAEVTAGKQQTLVQA